MTHVETPDQSPAAEVVPREPRVVGGHVQPWPRRLVCLIHRYGIFIADQRQQPRGAELQIGALAWGQKVTGFATWAS